MEALFVCGTFPKCNKEGQAMRNLATLKAFHSFADTGGFPPS